MNKQSEKSAEVIGEGTYGCIHKPSLKCKNKRLNYNNRVSKILLKKYAEKELHEYDILSRIDKTHRYYLGNPLTCEPDDNDFNEKSIKKCETFYEDYNNMNENNLIIMNDGGNNLEIFADKMHKMTKTQETTKAMELFWIEFHRVLMGIQLFLQNGILHFDMKPQNIVYDESKNRINIIDFGLMRKIEDVVKASNKSDNFLGVYHWSYPFECNFHNKKEFDDFVALSNDAKQNYYARILNNLNKKKDTSSFRNFFSFVIDPYDTNDNQSKMIQRYMDGFRNLITNEIKNYSHFLQSSLETVDVYGTGIAIAYVNNMTKHLVDEKMTNDLNELVFQMTTPVLSQRYTIEECIQRFEEILKIHTITQKHKVGFKNNKLVKTKSDNKKMINANTIILSKRERSSDEVNHDNINCPSGSEFDNATKKCHKKCPKGKIRNNTTRRCVKLHTI